MHLRTARAEDAEALCRLINLAFQVERFFVDGDRITLAEVRARLEAGEFFLAEENGSAAACVYLEPRGDRAYLGLLSVEPARQRNGLGAQLVAAAEQRSRELGCRAMDLLIVNVREELPPFYRRLGYTETGAEPFPADVSTKLPCHFIRMSKPL
jgi:N-acetylglutamate synthase-like GNAT family acetyltransferase